ncbi:hypothetical protein MUS_2529 [Bacillus velezensis YAU B9601-Y2]|uniref:Uncharacterized protein n=1 Tax=Bacillus amyloliquefaciens (strain Y2) TaxID=1155777 RepID=I2C733_BACAY|nr:hypothetical protein MUS_2529 [Bacillus velezensis YAU B9601-Y2]
MLLYIQKIFTLLDKHSSKCLFSYEKPFTCLFFPALIFYQTGLESG